MPSEKIFTLKLDCCVVSHCLVSHTRGIVVQMNKNYTTAYTLAINRSPKSSSSIMLIVSYFTNVL